MTVSRLPQHNIESKDIEYKKCSVCGRSFPMTLEFWHKGIRGIGGLKAACKLCAAEYYKSNKKRINKVQKEYYKKNKEEITNKRIAYNKANKDEVIKRRSEYYQKNKKKILEQGIEYRKKNKEKIAKIKAERYQKNKEAVAENGREYRAKNKEKLVKRSAKYYAKNKKDILSRVKEYSASPANYETYAEQLLGVEDVRRSSKNKEILEVKCAYCGRWIIPKTGQVRHRINSINGNAEGENRFYCTGTGCKRACPIYQQKRWPKGVKKASSREANPVLRQIVLKRDNYTCQECGLTIESGKQLHCHHVAPATQNQMTANDPDNCITLCRECHIAIHKRVGCKNRELVCNENADPVEIAAAIQNESGSFSNIGRSLLTGTGV